MNDLVQTVEELRRMSAAELTQIGEDSLLIRLREQAAEARARHGRLAAGNVESFLDDRDTVRYPTRVVFEFGEMGMHQFAQPEQDYRTPGGCMLYVRPMLEHRPDLVALAVSYMIPIINYGSVVSDAHCVAYGAVLLGLDEESYYRRICEMADECGADAMSRDNPQAHSPSDEQGEGCGGHGCSS